LTEKKKISFPKIIEYKNQYQKFHRYLNFILVHINFFQPLVYNTRLKKHNPHQTPSFATSTFSFSFSITLCNKKKL